MSKFSYSSTVSSQEAEALKEMIFKRARERAEALNEETQEKYTSSVHSDIMDLARASFVSSKNPFQEKVLSEEKKSSRDEEIGFAQRKVDETRKNIEIKNKILNFNIANKEVTSLIDETRADFNKKPTFTGALDFLNSQASISLIKNNGKSFEALA